MEKKLFVPALLMASVLLFGAGCNATTEENKDTEDNSTKTTFETKDADNESSWEDTNNNEEEKTEEVVEEVKSELTLSAEALGGGLVKLTWTKTDDIKTDAEKGFILVRSATENPEHNQTNFWFRQGTEKRETIWKDIPTGTQHFRICTLEQEKCSIYSNDVQLEVK